MIVSVVLVSVLISYLAYYFKSLIGFFNFFYIFEALISFGWGKAVFLFYPTFLLFTFFL